MRDEDEEIRESPGEEEDAPALAAAGRDGALRAVQLALVKEIDAAVVRLGRAPIPEATREHLEVLRVLLDAQVVAYLEHVAAQKTVLPSQTSAMYAGAIAAPVVVATTQRALLDDGVLTPGQSARLAQAVGDRRTVLVFGGQGTGKSTLLNALFELAPIDDRFVAVERGADLPALKERSFCVRLTAADYSDVTALFARARRMSPGRLVVGELQEVDVREFFTLLAHDTHVGGLATFRADDLDATLAALAAAFGPGQAETARETLAAARPLLAQMRTDGHGRPRLTGMWTVDGQAGGELELNEVDTGLPAAAALAALAAEG